MQYLKDTALIVGLGLLYFLSVYFAVAGLVPSLAYQAGLVALVVAMVTYRILSAAGKDGPGLPLALLFVAPVICLTAGVIWWGMRLLGFWEIFRELED